VKPVTDKQRLWFVFGLALVGGWAGGHYNIPSRWVGTSPLATVLVTVALVLLLWWALRKPRSHDRQDRQDRQEESR